MHRCKKNFIFKEGRMKKIMLLILCASSMSANEWIGRTLGDPDYGTHMAPLLTVIARTDGPILEMGCGDYSTPLLHALCAPTNRYLMTTDTDRNWLSLFLDLKTDWHNFDYVPVYEDDWELNPEPREWNRIGTDRHWSVILIDHRPGERRVVDIVRLRPYTDIFVVHDTQQRTYGYEPVLSTFKYKYVYTRYTTQTTVVSDTIDVESFFE
jgi:hypothetical protein